MVKHDLFNARLWFKQNGMIPNPNKYKARNENQQNIMIDCAGTHIAITKEIKLLGATLDDTNLNLTRTLLKLNMWKGAWVPGISAHRLLSFLFNIGLNLYPFCSQSTFVIL